MTVEQLAKKLQVLEEELKRTAPDLYAEISLVKAFHERAVKGKKKTYAGMMPKEAITRCLDLCGDFKLTKYEIATEIIENGYEAAPKAARGIINTSINRYLNDTGYLIEIDGLIGRASRN